MDSRSENCLPNAWLCPQAYGKWLGQPRESDVLHMLASYVSTVS